MSNVIAILKISGSSLPPYKHQGSGDDAAHVVVEESGGRLWLRLRGEPEVSGAASIDIVEDESGQYGWAQAVTIEVEAP